MDITPTTVVVVIMSISQPLPHTLFLGGFIQSFVDIDTAHSSCYNTSQMLVRQTSTAEEEAGVVEPHSITTAILPSQLYKLIVLISMFTM
jgi:hypothetical protein